MNGAQLKRKLTQVYGDEFHIAVAKELEVDKSTVYRWVSAKGDVPGVVASWIAMKISAGKGAKATHDKAAITTP